MHTTPMVALTLLLLAMTAFFNLAEMALVTARASKLEGEDESGSAQKVKTLKKRPGLFLAAIRAGDQITDLLTGAFVVTWIEKLVHVALSKVPVVGPYAAGIAEVAAFLLVTYVFLVFADLTPKSIALSAPESSAKLIAAPLSWIIQVARPFFRLLEISNAFLLKLLGIKQQGENRITEGEIRRTLSQGLSSGALVPFERSLLERVLDLDRRSVRTVMTGRRDVQSVRADAGIEQLKRSVLKANASLLLVTECGDLTDIVGVVARADVLTALMDVPGPDLRAMTMPLPYVPEYASVLSIFETLKTIPSHMVGVVDEYGSLLGIVTLNDVVEAIAGDVAEVEEGSVDNETRPFERTADGSYVVPGGMPMDDIVEAKMLKDHARRNYKTMAGFVIEHLRRIPQKGEVIELSKVRIEVAKVNNGTIEELRLVPKDEGGQ